MTLNEHEQPAPEPGRRLPDTRNPEPKTGPAPAPNGPGGENASLPAWGAGPGAPAAANGPTRPGSVWTWLDVALIGAAAFAVMLLGVQAISLALANLAEQAGERPSVTIWSNAALAGLEFVGLVGSVYLLGLRRRRLPLAAVGLVRPSLGWALAAGLIGLASIPVAGLIAFAIRTSSGLAPEDNPVLNLLAPQGFSWTGLVLMLVLVGLAGPFAEELYFRGVLFAWLRGRWGFWPGALASSLIFGIIHGEPATIVATALIGLLMAWIYEKSRSLWPAVIIHATLNTLNVLLLFLVLGLEELGMPGL